MTIIWCVQDVVVGIIIAVLRCPELQRPENGYFVNDYCDSVFNAACGIKCKPGFDLRGNSLRICQENGQWSGEPAECVSKHRFLHDVSEQKVTFPAHQW
jgi:hypothetical protein